ncbi:Uncharacterised protein [Citrobacter koseri]|uniref:Uncharacterized protein n=1 Tax=Citrobacter koseri TaxID=545 RepID=A0A2X2WL96_CITKO|nr:Uncharacterised protein [Citrobacter koseri]
MLSAFSLPLIGPMTTRFHPLLVVILGVKAFKSQLGAHGFRLLGAFEGAALHHPATFIFFLCRLFWRFRFTRDRRGLLRFRLRSRGVRRRLQQVLIRLLGCRLLRLLRLAWLLCRRSLRRTRLLLWLLVRLLRHAWLRTRLLNRLGVSPLLLLYLLLCLTLALQCLLTLFRRLFVPRHFVKLGSAAGAYPPAFAPVADAARW